MSEFSSKYEIIHPIGRGGMCEVMLARQLLFDRTVAIKVLKRSLAKSEECRMRFIREAKNCGKLSHESIVTIYEIGSHDEKPYISMQYLDGGSYEQWIIQGGKLNTGLSILFQTAQALNCAHNHGILHRDLKPDNILLTKDQKAKVADWGLAKMMDSAQEITHAGIVLGTPEYMSPEQIMSKPLSEASDLYSLGIMLYETVSGCLPFPSTTMTDILQAHLYKEPFPIRTLAPFISEDLENLIEFLLKKEPQERMPSAEIVVYELGRIIKNDYERYADITVKRKTEEEIEVLHNGLFPSGKKNSEPYSGDGKSRRTTAKTTTGKKMGKRGKTTVVIKNQKLKLAVWLAAIIVLGIGIILYLKFL